MTSRTCCDQASLPKRSVAVLSALRVALQVVVQNLMRISLGRLDVLDDLVLDVVELSGSARRLGGGRAPLPPPSSSKLKRGITVRYRSDDGDNNLRTGPAFLR